MLRSAALWLIEKRLFNQLNDRIAVISVTVAIRGHSMQVQQVCLSKEEIALRGREIYDHQIRQKVESNDDGKIVAIDVLTSEFVVRDNSLNAADALLANYPDAQIWFVRVGHCAVHRIGFAGSTLVK